MSLNWRHWIVNPIGWFLQRAVRLCATRRRRGTGGASITGPTNANDASGNSGVPVLVTAFCFRSRCDAVIGGRRMQRQVSALHRLGFGPVAVGGQRKTAYSGEGMPPPQRLAARTNPSRRIRTHCNDYYVAAESPSAHSWCEFLQGPSQHGSQPALQQDFEDSAPIYCARYVCSCTANCRNRAEVLLVEPRDPARAHAGLRAASLVRLPRCGAESTMRLMRLSTSRRRSRQDVHAPTADDVESNLGLPAAGANLPDQESCYVRGYSRSHDPR
jgi:hypothetical protein